MKNQKLRVALYLLLAVGLLTGLMSMGKNSGSSGTGELLWYGIGGKAKDADEVFGEVNKYLSSKKEPYTIKYDAFGWGDYGQKMALILNSGEPADIVFMASWAGNFITNAAGGYLTELDDMLNKAPALKKSIPQGFWDSVRVGGKIYSVPNYKDMVFQQYVAFKGSIADELGLDKSSVKTYEDFTPLLRAVHRKNPKMVAFDSPQKNMRADYLFGDQIPIALSFAEPGKGYQVLPDIKAFQDSIMMTRSWYEKGYIPQDALVAAKDGRPKGFNNWFIRIYQGFPGSEGGIKNLWGNDITIQKVDTPAVLTSSTPQGSMLSIPSASPNKVQALSFISLLNTDKVLRNLVGYGIEGVHYNKKGGTVIEQTERGKNDYNVPNFSLGSLLPLYVLPGDPPDAREQLKKFNESAEKSPALGFSIDSTEFKQEIATAQAISKPYMESLQYGFVPVGKTLTEWRQKLRDAGWYEVVAKINQRYKDWKAKQ